MSIWHGEDFDRLREAIKAAEQEREELIAALRAEESAAKHWEMCPHCGVSTERGCPIWWNLRRDAEILRQRVLAKVSPEPQKEVRG